MLNIHRGSGLQVEHEPFYVPTSLPLKWDAFGSEYNAAICNSIRLINGK